MAEQTKIVPVRLPLTMVARLDKEKKRQKIDRSHLIRRAITRFLDQMDVQKSLEKGESLSD